MLWAVTATLLQSGLAQNLRARDSDIDDPLESYVGVYDYQGSTVALAAHRGKLIAILDEAPYPMRYQGGDNFLDAANTPVHFRRGADGRVTGFEEQGKFYPIRNHTLPARLAALVTPRATSAPYRYRPPLHLKDGIDTGKASAAGFSPDVLAHLVDAVTNEHFPNVHSILLWRNGKLFFEEYFYGYDINRRHALRSATKSFISALVGIAIDKGLIRNDQQTVVDLLPWPTSSYLNPGPRKLRMTLADLLSMRSGLACDDWSDDSPGGEKFLYSQPEWVRFAMNLPMENDPGAVAHYCSAGVHIAGRIVEHASRQTLLQFANLHLFGPLGITNYRWPYQTVNTNVNTFGQIYLRPRDMLKFGILFEQNGVWNGRRLVSRSWVERSTSPLTQIGSRKYGYFWWRQSFTIQHGGQTQIVHTILASGNGGQKIYIVPSLDLVAVFTGGNYNTANDSPPNAIMGDIILPELLK